MEISHEELSDNIQRIYRRLTETLVNNPVDADATGLSCMALALLLNPKFSVNIFAQVREFHKKMGITKQTVVTPDGKRKLTEGALKFRRTLLKEEWEEYEHACDTNNVEKQFDALLDIIYVAAGTIVQTGWQGEVGWKRVHEANMKKQPMKKKTMRVGDTGQIDVTKPPGWEAPGLADLICSPTPLN